MDYWRHSTNLFEETNMELAVTHKVLDAYSVYCFLMEKINCDISGGLLMDDDKLSLFARKLCMCERKLMDIIKELLKRNLFNNDIYINSKILTNYDSESGKELVISKRQVKKNYIANKRKEANVEFYNGIVVNKDKDIDKVIDKDKINEIKSSEEPIIDEAKELERLKSARKLRKK